MDTRDEHAGGRGAATASEIVGDTSFDELMRFRERMREKIAKGSQETLAELQTRLAGKPSLLPERSKVPCPHSCPNALRAMVRFEESLEKCTIQVESGRQVVAIGADVVLGFEFFQASFTVIRTDLEFMGRLSLEMFGDPNGALLNEIRRLLIHDPADACLYAGLSAWYGAQPWVPGRLEGLGHDDEDSWKRLYKRGDIVPAKSYEMLQSARRIMEAHVRERHPEAEPREERAPEARSPSAKRKGGNRKPKMTSELTEMQSEVLQLAGELNWNQAAMARRLGVSPSTVRDHLRAIRKKLGSSLIGQLQSLRSPRTHRLPTDHDEQVMLSEEDDRRG